ncbi:MAG: hypothetical protein H7346_11165 [Burkholderiaceae bacterium]|nr:hypothetical protein [Burkholderiaceae bacterium]
MWAQLKMNHATATRSRAEVIIIAVALALIAVMLTGITMLARDQVHKAELREALRHSQQLAMSRCWVDAPNPLAMRNCVAEVALQSGMAPDQTYDLPTRASTAPVSDISVVSFKY